MSNNESDSVNFDSNNTWESVKSTEADVHVDTEEDFLAIESIEIFEQNAYKEISDDGSGLDDTHDLCNDVKLNNSLDSPGTLAWFARYSWKM